MVPLVAVIPQISISPAPLEDPVVEPYSPFSATPLTPDDGFRPIHLTPPPTLTKFHKPRSPLHPRDEGAPPHGLEPEQFNALLQATRERNVAFGGKKENDLRKEVALKVHKSKQLERRALFLSKVLAPPSPTATLTPKTPPDSPAIFHYSLPSPGLTSPLSLFDSPEDPGFGPRSTIRKPWVEQVDFRLSQHGKPSARDPTKRSLPSLDQISARIRSQAYIRSRDELSHASDVQQERPRLQVGVGRLQMPVRAAKPTPVLLPPTPSDQPPVSELQVTTLIVPRSPAVSPAKLSESNILTLNSRGRKADNMLATIRRRTLTLDDQSKFPESDGRFNHKAKRRSAPADLMSLRPRSGFEHPVLALAGGF